MIAMLGAIIGGVCGLIIGSFLNVLIVRRHAWGLGGRSRCLSCGAQIAWYDNIPLLSFLVLGGRCRHCKSEISLQYPMVELATGLLFAAFAYARPELPILIAYFGIIALLIAIFVYDLRHTIIPDMWVYTCATLALVTSLVADHSQFLLVVLAGPVAALPLFALWLVSQGRWMGLGDSKLALGIGWLLGPVFGIYAIFMGFVLGAIISVCILLPLPHIIGWLARTGIVQKRATQSYTMKSEVPFGPFLIAACFLVWYALLYGISLPFIWFGI